MPGLCTNPCHAAVCRGAFMHELICSCLQLPPDRWPPDHYTLLGLEPRQADTKQIENRVQERMERLRPYQLTHAEQVTEVMNRLAQALVCLTDPAAKQAYDAMLLRRPARRPNRPSSFHFSSRTEPERPPAWPVYSGRFPGWLLLAWSLWLSIGVAGLIALLGNFSDIKESYQRARDGVKAMKKSSEQTTAVPSLTGRRRP
jgi:hypothetical protein